MNLTTLALMVVSAFPACSFVAAQTPKSEVVYYADAYADHYGVPRALVRAIITQESGWNRLALSSKGAAGLMQLLPDTASAYGVKDLFSVTDNLRGGVHYLADLLNEFHGEMRLAVAAYFCGTKHLNSKGLSYGNPDVVAYVESVRLQYLRELRTEGVRSNRGQTGGQ
jgi:soluble lytic murein transglycosylase-like protein